MQPDICVLLVHHPLLAVVYVFVALAALLAGGTLYIWSLAGIGFKQLWRDLWPALGETLTTPFRGRPGETSGRRKGRMIGNAIVFTSVFAFAEVLEHLFLLPSGQSSPLSSETVGRLMWDLIFGFLAAMIADIFKDTLYLVAEKEKAAAAAKKQI